MIANRGAAPLPLDSDARSTLSDTERPSLLFATNGSPEAEAGLRFAAALARRDELLLRIVIVLEPRPPRPAQPSGTAFYVKIHRERAERILDRVREQADPLLGHESVSTTVLNGTPGAAIARAAQESGARYVVLGAGPHGRLERFLAGDTVVRVMRHTAVPVIAVPASCGALPRNAIVAVDFGSASLNAAHCAADVVAAGILQLVHVRPEIDVPATDPSSWSELYESGAQHLMTQLAEKLREGRPDIRVETTLLRGHPAETMLELATNVAADLIAVGQHGHGTLERLLFGSVAHALVRNAHCPVLVAPHMATTG